MVPASPGRTSWGADGGRGFWGTCLAGVLYDVSASRERARGAEVGQ